MTRRTLLATLILLASCKDLPEPFTLDLEFPKGDAAGTRITYNPGDDRNPSWSRNSDSIYYTAASFPPFPSSNGLLLAAPVQGGFVSQLLPAVVQRGPFPEPWLSAPVVTRDGQSLAYYDIIRHRDFGCDFILRPPEDSAFPLHPSIVKTLPRIQDATLEVRHLPDEALVAKHAISFQGVTFDTTRKPFNLPYVIIIDVHPYHQYYYRVGPAFLRPSWSPDGTRVVFTDGLDLYLWTVGTASPVMIPNTHDGVWPTWSPDGQWIAFTRLSRVQRFNPVEYRCLKAFSGLVAFFEITGVYDPTIPTVERIRVDGSSGNIIGQGEAPAWAPNGTEVVFVRDGSLMRANADGTNPRVISDETDAGEPSVSPDGKWLAFVKRNSDLETNDVWVAAF
jgi:hypothetical protein